LGFDLIETGDSIARRRQSNKQPASLLRGGLCFAIATRRAYWIQSITRSFEKL
jgi:hypothetical protein